MKSILKIIGISILSLYLVGCASGSKYSEISSSLGTSAPDEGRIYIYRTAVFGAAIQPQIKVNGRSVGKAVSKGFLYVDGAPGDYKIATTTEVDRQLSLTLNAGETRYVRLNVSFGFLVGHVYPELVENAVGEQEIQKCSYIGEP